MKVLIPTCKSMYELEGIIDELKRVSPELTLIINSSKNSAAFNRNRTLEQVKLDELVIMMDDDMTGFFKDWDKLLIRPFTEIDNVVMVSARLIRPNGRLGLMVGDNYNVTQNFVVVNQRRLPTACTSFVHKGIMFDENFKGSGFEDDDFCRSIAFSSNGVFVINNMVKLVHNNEMKNQKGHYWEHNKKHYLNKHKDEENRWVE